MNERLVKIVGLEEAAEKAAALAQFGKAMTQRDIVFISGNGLQDAAHRAENCLGWIWRQWLLGSRSDFVSERVTGFVERGLEFRRICHGYDYLPLHDLFLLHCAVFASTEAQLREVVDEVADADGDRATTPNDDGEIFAAAWCGMLKHWILGDFQKATEQSELCWKAKRPPGVLGAPKNLVKTWLKRDWHKFENAQQQDFERLWKRARADRWTVRSETTDEVVVTTDRYQIGQHWCWAHCGMAMLGLRQGIQVHHDPFYFPTRGNITKGATDASGSQLNMF